MQSANKVKFNNVKECVQMNENGYNNIININMGCCCKGESSEENLK